MNKLSYKTKFLNQIREISKIGFIEKFLVQRTQDKPLSSLFPKLIPNYYQYDKGTMRKAERNGINFMLDISDYMEYIIYYGIQVEPRDKLYNLVKDGNTVLDIGTNIGETLLNFAKVNPNGKNIGFEPVPYIYERAKRNLSLNTFGNLKIENIALSDKKETLSFAMPDNQNSGGVRMRKKEDKNEYGATNEVQGIQLDNYLSEQKIEKIDFIKMDVEGFEMNVLNGASNCLDNFNPILFIELDDYMLKQQNNSASELVGHLLDKKYSVQNADTNKNITASDLSNLTDCHFDIICTKN